MSTVMTPRLNEMVAQLHALRTALLHELEQIEQALEAFAPSPPPPAPRTAGTKHAILAALKLRAEPVDIGELLDAVGALGWSTDSSRPRNVIASTVAKLARDGAVERVEEGRYRVAPAETAIELEHVF